MIDEIPCGYRTIWTTGVRIQHKISCRACTEVLATLEVSRRPAQTLQQLQNLTIVIVKFHSILNAPPSLQVLSGAREDALAESESTLQISRGGWEHLEVLRSTGEGYRSVWEVCIWLPDQITFCWCTELVPCLDGWRRTWWKMIQMMSRLLVSLIPQCTLNCHEGTCLEVFQVPGRFEPRFMEGHEALTMVCTVSSLKSWKQTQSCFKDIKTSSNKVFNDFEYHIGVGICMLGKLTRVAIKCNVTVKYNAGF